MKVSLLLALGASLLAHSPASFAQDAMSATDCVGWMQISLPGGAEVAATAFDQLFEPRSTLYSEFDDGQPALYSKYVYAGVVQVTRPLSAAEIKEYMDDARKIDADARKTAENKRKFNTENPEGIYEQYLSSDGKGFGARRFRYFYAAKDVDAHAFNWQSEVPENRVPEFIELTKSLLNGVRSRDNFTLPAKAGVCMPYVFFPVQGKDGYGHSVATTYRLKKHPDVTVLLEDTTAQRPQGTQDPAKFTAVYKSNFFWTQDYRSYDSIKNLLTIRKHNNIEFAGQKGIESMVSMVRKDKVTEDYGYLVVTQGDPDAKADTPDLLLYVIRDAKNAEKRGVKPIGQEEFFKLAKEIAASVRHRPIGTSSK